MKINLKKTLLALAICTAGDFGPAHVVGTGATLLVTGKVAQGLLNQTDASVSSNNNGVNALNTTIQSGIAGSQATQVKGATQAPGM
jgi:hypothetical protein